MWKEQNADGEVLKQLIAREPIFHRPESGTKRADFDAMMAPEFWETGASGRRYSREEILDALEKRHARPHKDVWETSEFRCQQLGNGLYLLTYTLLQDGFRHTRRATIWRQTKLGWEIVYHQGTLVIE